MYPVMLQIVTKLKFVELATAKSIVVTSINHCCDGATATCLPLSFQPLPFSFRSICATVLPSGSRLQNTLTLTALVCLVVLVYAGRLFVGGYSMLACVFRVLIYTLV